jgi:hypothetical protein
MKLAIPTAALLLLLGTTASVYAQEKGQEEHSTQQAKPAQTQAKPAQPERQAKPAAQERQAKPAAQQPTKSAKPAQQPRTQQAARTQPRAQQAAKQPVRAQAEPAQPRTQQARESRPATGNSGASSHGRISDAHYASSFGSGHNFHVNQGEFNNRRFSYGGYSFGFVDPWPVGWGYSDDVYVVYVDGGYYMCDVVHPGVRLSISIL